MQKVTSYDTYELNYYDKHNTRQTVTMRKDENDHLVKINSDGSETALCRYEVAQVVDAPIPCENYNNLKNMKTIGSQIAWNKLFHESFDIMKSFYAGDISANDVSEYIRKTCCFSNSTKNSISESLSMVYEHMSRANTRNAVEKNLQECENLCIETGIKADTDNHFSNRKGSIYYNSDYYFMCDSMQETIKETLNKLAEEFGVEAPDYDALDKSITFPDGGITYNDVWNQKTYELLHYHGMDSIAFIDSSFVPSKNFIYFESNLGLNNNQSSDQIITSVKEYVNKRLRRITDTDNRNLLIEYQKHSPGSDSHKSKRDMIHKLLNTNGIPVNSTPNRLWLSDYLGMVLV